MISFKINNLIKSNYSYLVTLLDYRIKISDYFKIIHFNENHGTKVIIDTALISGINSYRFIESFILPSGYLDIKNIKYIDLNKSDHNLANKVLREHKNLDHSVLNSRQKNNIFKLSENF